MTWDKAEKKAEKLFGEHGYAAIRLHDGACIVGRRHVAPFEVEESSFEKAFVLAEQTAEPLPVEETGEMSGNVELAGATA